MNRKLLNRVVQTYEERLLPFYESNFGYNERESQSINRFKEFIRDNDDCLERTNLAGHLTGSALVVNESMDRVVLTLHGKLKEWLQLGGHADGQVDLWRVALIETQEESGLKDLFVLSPFEMLEFDRYDNSIPFDIDTHGIPEHKGVPAHRHYDARYLVIAKDEELTISDESDDLRWFTVEEARELCPSEAMQRQFRKLELMREKCKGRDNVRN